MSRGNQREVDRQKAQAKTDAKVKALGRGGDPLKRNENDAAALQAKVAAKLVAKDTAAGTTGTNDAPVVPKKVKKVNAVDDLLLAGLGPLAGKKKAMSAK